MRLWSIHPKYLDTKGLVALWRESLLAKHVLEGKTKGYTNHPQLNRFKTTKHSVPTINAYLLAVWQEATKRGYNFNKDKIGDTKEHSQINVSTGQIDFEKKHLLKKIKERDIEKHNAIITIRNWHLHPLFTAIDGPIEIWERV